MMTNTPRSAACTAFDRLASTYDARFTRSLVGRAQRDVVWEEIDSTFGSGNRVLELNCGTGEDALHLAVAGVEVLACDGSAAMIAVASERKLRETPTAPLTFINLTTEEAHLLYEAQSFDGVLSNFSGLNCVEDLHSLAQRLARSIRAGGKLLLCFSTRFCIWEFLWYTGHLNLRGATRRWGGRTEADVSGLQVPVFYPTVSRIAAEFGPLFTLERLIGVGVLIPPSYVNDWAKSHPVLFRLLCNLDRSARHLPGLRVLGDHVLLRFRRSNA